ncbi:universal stress protein [Chryseosolibacter indicus]|uniref:Universal stress protein n=1 Tax=Chryseosolibacter indicus TaxID=2782351 RepID=A0ABS5VRE1_9BACT|nr:universal stress protein [Chryseosolibacter indicus]MBT1703736.1 universal stress protein [Chryseosolibacter indicus]
MKKILVPCDFSKPAINAFRFALDLASQSKGSIELLHVVELPVMHDTVLMPVLNFEEELLKELKEKSEGEFSKIITKYNKDNVKATFNVVFGAPSLQIIDYIKNNNIDLVIMGSHGASGLREIFVGSNAEKIVRHSPVPVLVIKNYLKGSIKNIAFPNDLEEEDQEELVHKVKTLQSFFDATLHLVRINTPLNFRSDIVTRERLKAFAKHHGLKNYTINIFNHPNEEDGILEFSNFIKADIIAMGTHARKGIGHLLNGSVTEDVTNHTNKPIWTYSFNNELAQA